MGSLSNDTEQDSLPKGVKAKHKTNRSWQLLFVDERGKIVSHAWFKSTAIIIFSVLLLSIVCSITLSFFFIKNRNENIGLKEGLEVSESRIKTLQNERDILLARLVLAESKIKSVSDQNPVLKQMPVEAEKNVKSDDSAGKKNSSSETVPKKQDLVEKSIPEIEVKDFGVSYEPYPNNELKIQFVIRNRSQGLETVQGYIFLVLKQEVNDHKGWLTIPSAEFSEGKPLEITKGKFFRISRFKTIRFRMSRPISPEQYKTATVLIFNKEGIKHLEKSFPVIFETVHSDNSHEKIPINGAQAILKETDNVKPVEKKSEIRPVKVYGDAGDTKNRGKSSSEIQPEISKKGPAKDGLKQ